MIRSLQRDENDRCLEVGDELMTPFWKPEIIHYGEHHLPSSSQPPAGGAHEIQASNEVSVP